MAAAASSCDGVVVVLPPGCAWDGPPVEVAVPGGASRSESVRAGLAAVRAGADGAVPGLPVVDTRKRVDGERVVETVPRQTLVAVQTPQAFRAGALRAAHAADADATDDAALVEAAGGTVVVVPGEPDNLKVTTPHDLARAAFLIQERETAAAPERFTR